MNDLGSDGTDESWSYSRYILKVRPVGLLDGTGSFTRTLAPWTPDFYSVFMLLHVNGLSSMPPVPWPDNVIGVHFG